MKEKIIFIPRGQGRELIVERLVFITQLNINDKYKIDFNKQEIVFKKREKRRSIKFRLYREGNHLQVAACQRTASIHGYFAEHPKSHYEVIKEAA